MHLYTFHYLVLLVASLMHMMRCTTRSLLDMRSGIGCSHLEMHLVLLFVIHPVLCTQCALGVKVYASKKCNGDAIHLYTSTRSTTFAPLYPTAAIHPRCIEEGAIHDAPSVQRYGVSSRFDSKGALERSCKGVASCFSFALRIRQHVKRVEVQFKVCAKNYK